MRTSKKSAVALAGALGVAGLGIAVAGPALADALPTAFSTATTTDGDTTDGDTSDGDTSDGDTTDGAATQDEAARLADRVARLSEALAGLVDDGTLTQDQADAVAETLAASDALRGRGGHGPGGLGSLLDDAAGALGLAEEDVRTALADGSTLAELAQAQGLAVEDLVDSLVAAATSSIEERVAAGDLSQDRADQLTADLAERIADMVENGGPMGGRGPGGHGPGGATRGLQDGSTSSDGAEGAAALSSTT